MLVTIILAMFMYITNYMKLTGIRLLKNGKVHGILIIMLMKILFWLSVIELIYIWVPKLLLFAIPVVFLTFLVYVFMEKNLFYEIVKGKKEEAIM